MISSSWRYNHVEAEQQVANNYTHKRRCLDRRTVAVETLNSNRHDFELFFDKCAWIMLLAIFCLANSLSGNVETRDGSIVFVVEVTLAESCASYA